jgi:hypothetical protein
MNETKAPAASDRLVRRTLFYGVASILVLVVLKTQAPQQLCHMAEGFTNRINQVNPWFIQEEFGRDFAARKAEALAHCGEFGTRDACSGLFSWLLEAAWQALGATVGSDGGTLVLSLLALGVAGYLLWKLGVPPHPLALFALFPLAGGISWLVWGAAKLSSEQLGCGSTLMLVLAWVWPFFIGALELWDRAKAIHETARALENRFDGQGKGARPESADGQRPTVAAQTTPQPPTHVSTS